MHRAGLAGGRTAFFETAAGRVEGQTVQAECVAVSELSVAVNPGLAGIALLG